MTAKLIRLEDWAAATYGEAAPQLNTLRRWAREARITPRPVKHGRTYFVAPDAAYVAASEPGQQQKPRRRRLVVRLNDGTSPKKCA